MTAAAPSTPTVAAADLDAINALATEEFGPWSAAVEITQAMIDAFADLTGDRQWIHVDVERATRESPFGGPIAHGFLTLSLLPQVTERPVIVEGHGGALNYGAESLRFLAPVPVGSLLHGCTRVVGAVATPKGTLVTTEAKVAVVDAPKPALLYRMQVLYLSPRPA